MRPCKTLLLLLGKKLAMAIFWPTQLTYQSRPIVNLFNFCVFHPILIRFGLEANIGLRTTWNEFWITTAIIWPTGLTNRSGPIANLFNFYANLFNFYVLVQLGWNLVSGQQMLLPYSCFCPALALPSFMVPLCNFIGIYFFAFIAVRWYFVMHDNELGLNSEP